MSKLLVLANEATASQRRVYFHLVDATDGLTAETGEAGGQPQVSSDGAAFTNTGIGTLTAIGNGRYYADLTQTLVQTAGTQIETRYKSANTAECPGDSVQVVAFDPNDSVRMGLTALPNAAADAAGGLPISDAGGLDLDAQIGTKINDILTDTGTTLQGELDGIQADTEDIQTRLPAALVSGRIDAIVGAMAANVMTAAAAAADLTTELQSGLATAAALATAQTSIDDIPTNAELATALAAADDAVLAAIAALNNLSAAQVNAEVVDALATDTYAEPGQGTPSATLSLAAKINYLFKNWRNRKTQTSSQWSLYNDDATTVDQKATVSDDGTTAGKTEITTGP